MFTKTFLTTSLSLLLIVPAAQDARAASEHGSSHGSMQMHESDMSPGHGVHEELLLLGEQTVDNVKATAHLNDVREALAKAGMKETHHLQILFTDTHSGKTIETGTVAVKITTPSGETLPTKPFMGMEGHFGADITLAQPGTYQFSVGTKLADGKKRQYGFSHQVD